MDYTPTGTHRGVEYIARHSGATYVYYVLIDTANLPDGVVLTDDEYWDSPIATEIDWDGHGVTWCREIPGRPGVFAIGTDYFGIKADANRMSDITGDVDTAIQEVRQERQPDDARLARAERDAKHTIDQLLGLYPALGQREK